MDIIIKKNLGKAQVFLYRFPFILPSLTKASPERRCSSRTFRYGYLVTT